MVERRPGRSSGTPSSSGCSPRRGPSARADDRRAAARAACPPPRCSGCTTTRPRSRATWPGRCPGRRRRAARFGTRFHAWVEARFGQQPLLDPDDLPGRADPDIDDDADLDALIEAFEAGPFADRVPHAVEAPFALVLGRPGRPRPDRRGLRRARRRRFLLVDWKTNRQEDADPLQLALYRLAWAELPGVPLERVRAAFHYVRTGRPSSPPDLPDRQALEAMLGALSVAATPPRRGRRPAGAVGADGAGRGAVADELDARVGDRRGAVELDAAVRASAGAVAPGAPRRAGSRSPTGSRRPASNVPSAIRTPSGSMAVEHRVPLVGAEPLGLPLLLAQRQPGDAHDAGRREPAAHPLLDQRDRGPPPTSGVKSSVRQTGSRRVTQSVSAATGAISPSSCTADAPPPTTTTRRPRKPPGRGSRAVCSCCAAERLGARVGRHERPRPGPGRVHHGPGQPAPVAGAHLEQPVVGLDDLVDPHRPQHRQVVGALVVGEVRRHHLVRAARLLGERLGVRQRRDAVHVVHGQRVPAVLPRPARRLVGVEHDVVDPAAPQVVRRRQPGLAGADHHRVEDLHAG